jgi:uncharacterized RDD family membrane protein YckC
MGNFESAMNFLDRSRDALTAEKGEAEISRRWLAGWNLLPIALVVVPFIFAHQPIAEWLSNVLASSGGPTLSKWAPKLSLLLAGTPALFGYMLLAHYGRQLFRRLALRSIRRQDGAGAGLGAALERTAERQAASAIEVHATSYASFGRRTVAHLLDWVGCMSVAMIPFVILSLIFFPTNDIVRQPSQSAPAAAAASTPDVVPVNDAFNLAVLLAYVIIFWLYHALSLASARQATPGMRIMNIFVTDLAGRPPSLGRASGRHFASILSYYSAMLGFLMQPFNERRQTLHDRLSGTVVLNRPAKV